MNELSDLISEIKDGGKLVLEHGREYHLFADDCFIYETEKTAESEGEAIRAAVFLSGNGVHPKRISAEFKAFLRQKTAFAG